MRYITHPNGTPAGYIAPEGQAWLLTDRLGSIIGLVDGVSGTLIGRYSYDPYGLPRGTDETNTLAGRNIHRYAGGIHDKTTKLTRFGVRWYDPSTGRFTTPDPSGKETNPYLYALANPCNRFDLGGEEGSEDPVYDFFRGLGACVTGGVVGSQLGAGGAFLVSGPLGAPLGGIGGAVFGCGFGIISELHVGTNFLYKA